jgi:NAD(P)-dependent dehydrogenase (short-subunit alcohol dehydrogenase family)
MKSFRDELFELEGKIAFVTGGGKGLGHGYSVNLAKAGATVICFGRSLEPLEKTVKEITNFGGKAMVIQGDITQLKSIESAMEKVVSIYGQIDILVNNAGTEIPEMIFDVTEDHFEKIMDVNIKGTYMAAKVAAGYMREQKSGKIINIASLGSFIGLAESTVYCCSKGAVMQFTKALSIELAPYNIQVNAIAPGYFLTEMTKPFFEDEKHSAWILERIPLNRIGTEDDLAGTAIFLSAKASDYMTGQTLIVDGGWLAS